MRKFWKVLWKLVKQSTIPFLISILYATWVYSSKPAPAPFTDWITPFAGSFFFCMWLLGQFLRTSKQVSDAETFTEISAGIAEINKSVSELKAASVARPLVSTAQPNRLFVQAKELVHNGYVIAGLLQGGLAFEQAVYDKASRIGLNRSEYRSLPRLIAEIEKSLGSGAQQEIQVLWKLRNQIVHADEEALEQLQHQPELISMFERGIEMLGQEHA